MAISLWEVIFLSSKRILVLICMLSQFMWRKDFEKERNSADSYLCFWLALFYSVLYFFLLHWSPSSSLCMAFDYISCNIDEVLSINLSPNLFVFGDFKVHHKDWLTYYGGTDRSGKLCSLFFMKITASATKSLYRDCHLCYCCNHCFPQQIRSQITA